ncbi:fluoride efflux transporter CrcB [Alicyclobacillus ferrooxydans]|nr:fluoride efflux transporter CrcB [Alicyclobacillus ferrooxydans]
MGGHLSVVMTYNASWILVGLGGSLGAAARYLVGRWAELRYSFFRFPIGTLLVNVTGSFLLGLITRSAGLLLPHYALMLSLFLGVGFCGAYTTFSTFSYETITLIRQHRRTTAVIYVAASLLIGFAASGLGLYGLPHM